MAVEEKESVSDSDEDTQPEVGGVAIVNTPQKYLSPQNINAHPQMAGMKRHDFEHSANHPDYGGPPAGPRARG